MYRSTFHFAFIVIETTNETEIMTMCLCNESRKRSVISSYNYLNFIMPKANDRCTLMLEKSCIWPPFLCMFYGSGSNWNALNSNSKFMKLKIMHTASISSRFAFVMIFNIKFKSDNNEAATFALASVCLKLLRDKKEHWVWMFGYTNNLPRNQIQQKL